MDAENPAPYPFNFYIYRLNDSDTPELEWKDTHKTSWLNEGDTTKKVTSSKWTVPETGTYLVTINSYPPEATLYATFKEGPPAPYHGRV